MDDPKRSVPFFEELMKAYPEGLMALFGASDLENITSAAGFLNVELFGFMVPLLFIVFAVGLGSGAIAGEEGRATMEILLAEPVDRGRVVLEKSGAMIAATVVLGIVLWVAMVVGAVAVDIITLHGDKMGLNRGTELVPYACIWRAAANA